MRVVVLCAALLIPLVAGCTHVEYAQGRHDVSAVHLDDPPYAQSLRYDFSLKTREITLLDTTGVVCASVGSGLEAGNAYLEGKKGAEKAGRTTFTYKYRQHSPSEYAGLQCGAYARWGNGADGTHLFSDYDAATNTEPESYEQLTLPLPAAKMGEGGFHLGGVGYITPKVPALRWSFLWRFGLGRYRLTPYEETSGNDLVQLANIVDVEDDKMYVKSPFHVGLLFYPKYLLGLGGQVYGGMDPISALLTRDRGKGYQKFDYGAKVSYSLAVKMFAFTVFGEFKHQNFVWGEHWNQEQGWAIGGSIAVDPDLF